MEAVREPCANETDLFEMLLPGAVIVNRVNLIFTTALQNSNKFSYQPWVKLGTAAFL